MINAQLAKTVDNKVKYECKIGWDCVHVLKWSLPEEQECCQDQCVSLMLFECDKARGIPLFVSS